MTNINRIALPSAAPQTDGKAFLSLAGFEDRLEGHARELRRTVGQRTGIPVSVGIAPTKLLAKVANRSAKKEAQDDALARIELTDLWGIARRLAVRLKDDGISTPLELRAADPQALRQRFGVVMQRMVLELRGISCLELLTSDRKSIVSSRSFGRLIKRAAERAGRRSGRRSPHRRRPGRAAP